MNDFKDFRKENGSSQDQNPALTGSFVSSSLDISHVFCAKLAPGAGRPAPKIETTIMVVDHGALSLLYRRPKHFFKQLVAK